jgi:hypothetical protein
MKSINIIFNHLESAEALERYFKFVLGINHITKSSLNDPYGQKELFEKAMKSDLLVVDGFTDGKSKGFQFTKTMEKQTLVLFYAGEIDIEEEGPFWLLLPYAIDRLGNKTKEILEQPAPGEEEYKALEERFPELRERKGHHH